MHNGGNRKKQRASTGHERHNPACGAELSRFHQHFRCGAAASLCWLCLAQGCAVVAPYERERLARPDMELGRNVDLAAGEEHAANYREGSSGATGTSGGGCGCN
jgi:hypothetical protein